MANEVNLTKAKQVYQEICAAMDEENWKYKKQEEELVIESGARGDDLPMELLIRVHPKQELIVLLSHLPYKISEDKRVETAVAIAAINNRLVDGNLDYNVANGNLVFRMTNSYRDSLLGREVYKYLLYVACQTVDDFNDKLLMLSKGLLTVEQFIEQYTKE